MDHSTLRISAIVGGSAARPRFAVFFSRPNRAAVLLAWAHGFLFLGGATSAAQQPVVHLNELAVCDLPYGIAPAFVERASDGAFVFVNAADGRILECSDSGEFRVLGVTDGDFLSLRSTPRGLQVLSRKGERIVVLDQFGETISEVFADFLTDASERGANVRAISSGDDWLVSYRDESGSASVVRLSGSRFFVIAKSLNIPGSGPPLLISGGRQLIVVSVEFPFAAVAVDLETGDRQDIDLETALLPAITVEGLAKPWRLVSISAICSRYVISFRDVSSTRRFAAVLDRSWRYVASITDVHSISLLGVSNGEILGMSIDPHLRLYRFQFYLEPGIHHDTGGEYEVECRDSSRNRHGSVRGTT